MPPPDCSCVVHVAWCVKQPHSGPQKKRRPKGADNSLARESYTEQSSAVDGWDLIDKVIMWTVVRNYIRFADFSKSSLGQYLHERAFRSGRASARRAAAGSATASHAPPVSRPVALPAHRARNNRLATGSGRVRLPDGWPAWPVHQPAPGVASPLWPRPAAP